MYEENTVKSILRLAFVQTRSHLCVSVRRLAAGVSQAAARGGRGESVAAPEWGGGRRGRGSGAGGGPARVSDHEARARAAGAQPPLQPRVRPRRRRALHAQQQEPHVRHSSLRPSHTSTYGVCWCCAIVKHAAARVAVSGRCPMAGCMNRKRLEPEQLEDVEQSRACATDASQRAWFTHTISFLLTSFLLIVSWLHAWIITGRHCILTVRVVSVYAFHLCPFKHYVCCRAFTRTSYYPCIYCIIYCT